MRGAIEAVEASWSAVGAGNTDRWLQATVRALAPVIGAGAGTIGYRFDARGHPRDWTVTTPFVHDGPAAFATTTTALFALAPPSLRLPLYRPTRRAHLLSELNGYRLDELPLGNAAEVARELGIVDFLGVHAGSPDGLGAMFAAGIPKPTPLPSAKRAGISRIAGHLAAAYRLVVAFERPRKQDVPAAVFDANGRVLDMSKGAEGDASPLRAAVRAMDRARGPLRRSDPAEALGLWRALVEGRYSLVDRFESDGKRFVVAYRNAPGALDPRGLSERESAVAGLVTLALSDKAIAYELGMAEGTVRAHVHSVLKKLGAPSRVAAIELLAPALSAEQLALDERGTSVVVFSEARSPHGARLDALTAAEREIVELLVRGKTTAAIAKLRGRSASTVAKQISSLFRKLGVHSRAALARQMRE